MKIMEDLYKRLKEFKRKYPLTVGWRLKQNLKIVEKHLMDDEQVIYIFVAQKNNRFYDFLSTAVVVLTNKRIIIGRKRVVFGYFVDYITPEMFNDLNVRAGLIWGKVIIDTAKERVFLTNIDKRALPEISNTVNDYILDVKRKLGIKNNNL